MRKDEFFKRLQKKFSVTYYYSTKLFPLKVRRRVWRLYAFLRIVDEIVDNPEAGVDTAEALNRLEGRFWNRFVELKEGGSERRVDVAMEIDVYDEAVKELIIDSFIEMAREFEFDRDWIAAFFEAMRMDLTIDRYQTYAQLRRYMYGSAAVVGLMMNKLMGGSHEGEEAAGLLGEAMQLTNFLRDVKEDYERGRIYLPREDMERFGVKEGEFEGGKAEGFEDLIGFEVGRCEELYEFVLKRVGLIPRRCRVAVLTSALVYMDVLRRIKAEPGMLWRKDFKKTIWSFPKAIWKARKLAGRVGKIG